MGTWGARELGHIVDLTRTVLGIEYLQAAQGFEFRRPLRSSPALERAHAWLRREVPALEADRYLHPDILAAARLVPSLAECIQIDL